MSYLIPEDYTHYKVSPNSLVGFFFYKVENSIWYIWCHNIWVKSSVDRSNSNDVKPRDIV